LLTSITTSEAIVDIVAADIWTKGEDSSGSLHHAPRYYAFVVTKDIAGNLRSATIDLGSQSDADRHVSHWLALLSDRSADPAKERIEADWIGQHIWEPLAHQLHGTRNVIIVPDGVFNVMPWVALRSATKDRFLIEDGYNFATELSVEYVGEIANRRDKALGTGALLVGDLNFGNAVPGQTREIYVGATMRINDGLLSAEEIAGLNLGKVELVVLSACETARGVTIGGEGSFGLQRTFLMAGARAVVAGLWRVDDQATKDQA
jgi:hypothetical protein